MKRYFTIVGFRDTDDAECVYVQSTTGEPRRLKLRLDLANHSPTGFAWGYMGSGPSQLALAILADLYGDRFALRHYMQFKSRVIANLAQDAPFTLTEEDIRGKMIEIVGDQRGPVQVGHA